MSVDISVDMSVDTTHSKIDPSYLDPHGMKSGNIKEFEIGIECVVINEGVCSPLVSR